MVEMFDAFMSTSLSTRIDFVLLLGALLLFSYLMGTNAGLKRGAMIIVRREKEIEVQDAAARKRHKLISTHTNIVGQLKRDLNAAIEGNEWYGSKLQFIPGIFEGESCIRVWDTVENCLVVEITTWCDFTHDHVSVSTNISDIPVNTDGPNDPDLHNLIDRAGAFIRDWKPNLGSV